MIPFLKHKEEGAASAMDEDENTKRRNPDDEEEDEDDGMLDAIAEDMLSAMAKKDKGLLKESLDALCQYIRDEVEKEDEIQDENMME